jgi:hypothetical protein
MEEKIPDFSGKTVVFYITTPFSAPRWATDGVVLESPSFQTHGSRLFVIGRTPKDAENTIESDWSANQESGLAWDSVLYYVVMGSEEYQVKMQVPAKQPIRSRLLNLFITVMGVCISVSLLAGIIVWIIKML